MHGVQTHPLGQGTVNFPVNLLKEERDVLGRLAVTAGCSMATLIRSFMYEGLAHVAPDEAARLVEIRRHRKAVMLAVVGLWAALMALWPDSHIDARRASGRQQMSRIVRTIRPDLEAV